MKKIKQIIIALALVLGGLALVAPATVSAVNVFDPCPVDSTASDGAICANQDDQAPPFIKTVVNTLLFVVGVISVIVIIVGGIMYTVSGGDSGGVTKAKNTILYAVVGLVVAFLAYAIVNWVVGAFNPASAQQQCQQNGGTYNVTAKTCKKKA